ncbi:MAG: DUF4153 domain-containing protein [Maricaulaceae bacterium]
MSTHLKRWTKTVPNVSAVLSRFPVPAALMAIFTVLIILFKDSFHRDEYEAIGRLCVGLVIAGYACVCVCIGWKEQGKPRTIPLQILLSFMICLLAWFSKDLRLNGVMAVGAILLTLGNSVRFRRARDDLHIWDFTHKLWTGAVFATVGSVIFTLGLLAIMAALKLLFGLNIRYLVEDLLLPIGLAFLAPLYWLATLPPADETCEELSADPGFVSKAVAFLGTWLLAPLTLIFALILLAYGVKIAAMMELPKGEIGGLVTPFLIVGTLTWLVLEPPFIQKNAIARAFRKIWFLVSIPATLLLAISIFVRIREYGLTPERIALAALVLWSFIVSFIFGIGKEVRRDIRIIPGFAALLLAIGAFSSGLLSIQSQTSRAKTNLIQAGIMTAQGELKSLEERLVTDNEAAKRAKGAIRYLMKQDADKEIAKLFPNNEMPDNAFVELGIEDISTSSNRRQYSSYDGRELSMSIEGYKTLIGPFNAYNVPKDAGRHQQNMVKPAKVYMHDYIVIAEVNNLEVGRIDLEKWLTDNPPSDSQIKIENPLMPLSADPKSAALLIKSMNVTRDENGELSHANMEVFLLTRD